MSSPSILHTAYTNAASIRHAASAEASDASAQFRIYAPNPFSENTLSTSTLPVNRYPINCISSVTAGGSALRSA